MIWLTAGASVVATALFTAIILITWRGNWTHEVEAARIDLLAHASLAMCGLMGLGMIGILVAGPLSKITVKAGDAEIMAEGDQETNQVNEVNVSIES